MLMEPICSNSGRVGVSHCPAEIPQVCQNAQWAMGAVGNETRQTMQRVSSNQQLDSGVERLRRGVKLCVMQSTRVQERAFGSESPYR
ncbi:hypothetical protein TNCV_4957911 [Trichonephila clavipes]|nr:hypothetical protein TNCV_4957911 [Trichonephila clavipes]